jgi:anaerobic selenocysteine-containing dehydrogenase
MHPEDAQRLGLHDRQHVAVASRFGQATSFLKLDDSITPGVCFMPIHWNDLWAHRASPNEATSNLRDPISKQPALKAVAVRVAPANAAPPATSTTAASTAVPEFPAATAAAAGR